MHGQQSSEQGSQQGSGQGSGAAPAARVERVVPFAAGDGFPLNLIHVRGATPPTRGPVLLVHGAGVRANIFRAPVRTTLVDYLIDRGHDVWMENWRASIDVPPSEWTLDRAAVHDHPAAVRAVLRETGAPSLKAVIHCQGSTSFMMAAVAGLLPEVTTIVSNAVSLHPVVPRSAALKLNVAVPLIGLITPYVNPQWGLDSPTPTAKAITALVKLTHHECDNIVCRYASFTYGTGFPTLWRHENLNDATHEWLKGEFAAVPISFFRQMSRCVRHGSLVAVEGLRELPADLAAQPPRTDARVAFLAGARNRCFLAESQARTHAWFTKHTARPERHALHVFPDYGHLDVFMGQDAARDTFPVIANELETDT
jgi:pimeloyl-ACP methyl ester carboxylesterase